MKFVKYLKESNKNIKILIDEFIKDNKYYRYYKTEEDFRGTCDGVSSDLYKFFKDKGFDIKLIEGIGVKFELPKDHPHVNIPQFVSHVVAQIGNKIIDLTGKQFGFDKVRIITLLQFKKEFKKIKSFEAWKR
jgi:hypothetical protein